MCVSTLQSASLCFNLRNKTIRRTSNNRISTLAAEPSDREKQFFWKQFQEALSTHKKRENEEWNPLGVNSNRRRWLQSALMCWRMQGWGAVVSDPGHPAGLNFSERIPGCLQQRSVCPCTSRLRHPWRHQVGWAVYTPGPVWPLLFF